MILDASPTTLAALLLAALGIISAGLGVRSALRQPAQRPLSPDESPTRGWRIPFEFKAWYGFLAASVICFVLAIGSLVVDIAENETMINIVSHDAGDAVAYEEFVRGTSQHVPDDCTIWLVIASHDASAYYPQAEVTRLEPGGDWSTRALIGTDLETSGSFDLLAVMADLDAYPTLKAHMTSAFSGDHAPPLEALPDGVTVYDRIAVIRQ